MTPHRAVYRSSPPNHIPLILAAAASSWVALSVVVYLVGGWALTLLDIIGGAL